MNKDKHYATETTYENAEHSICCFSYKHQSHIDFVSLEFIKSEILRLQSQGEKISGKLIEIIDKL